MAPRWSNIVGLTILLSVPFAVRARTWRAEAPPPVDIAEAESGKTLFLHEWSPHDPLCPDGDGLGPVFNAKSCVACHRQGGVGGSGPNDANVTTFVVRASVSESATRPARSGVVHSQSTSAEFQESLKLVHPELPFAVPRPQVSTLNQVNSCNIQMVRFPAGVHVSERKTPALFGAKLIDDLPSSAIIENERRQKLRWGLASSESLASPVGRASRLADGRIGRFGWKAQTASLNEFVQAACANELGLGNAAQAQPTPLSRANYKAPGIDLTREQCSQITAFIGSLPRPIERPLGSAGSSAGDIDSGREIFVRIGCADCHQPEIASLTGIYSDLLLHDMGPDGTGDGSYNDPSPEPTPDPERVGPRPGEWRTPPLWGVADAGPYLHDGRAATLEDAIAGHGGQGERSRAAFQSLSPTERFRLLAFLGSLRAPEVPQ